MSSKRIKGITIEIDGNATGLDKALKGTDSNISKVQSSLKDVNRLLKIDPKNTELLAQKQKLLSQAVGETKEKLEIEKTAFEQAAKTDMPTDKMDALKREIIATTQELENLERQSKDAAGSLGNSVQEAGEKIKEIGAKTVDIGKTFSTHVTAPIAAVGTASIAAFNEVDTGMDIIKQKTGAAGEALSEMTDIAKNIATSIPTGFEAAGTAVGEVNTRFGLTGDALEQLSEKFIKFADLNGTDVSNSIDSTQKVLTAFGLEAEDAGLLLDTMNAVGQRTGIGMDDLAKSMITNSASLQQMGFSASDAANFLGNVEVSGADTSQVMSGLTKALSNATAEGKPMNEALKELQNSMVNAENETEGLQAAYDLFGKRAGAAIYQACKEGSLSFEELGTSMQDNIGSVDDTYESTLDGTDKFKTGMNSLKIAGAELGEVVGNTLAPMIERASEKIGEVTERFSELSPNTKEMIVKIGMIVAAIGPVLVITGTLISTIGTITTAIGTFISFLGGISGAASVAGGGIALFSGPLLPIAGIIAGVVAAGVLLYQNWDTIKEKAAELKDNIKEKFDVVKENITGAIEEAKEKASGKLAEIKDNFSAKASEIKTDWTEKFTSVKDTATEKMQMAKQNVSEKLESMKAAYDEKGGGMKGTVSAVFTGIKDIMDSQMMVADAITGGRLENIRSTFQSKLDTAKSAVSSRMEDIRSAFSSKMEDARAVVDGTIDRIKGAFNFSWSLPKLKLPHFNITGKFSINPPSVPRFGVEWYKKGGIMDDPTVFGINGQNVMVGGEDGEEAILPLEPFYTRLTQILDSKLTNQAEKFVIEMPIYINGNYSKKEIAEIAMKGISQGKKHNARGTKINIRK